MPRWHGTGDGVFAFGNVPGFRSMLCRKRAVYAKCGGRGIRPEYCRLQYWDCAGIHHWRTDGRALWLAQTPWIGAVIVLVAFLLMG
jgi:hypothetical protein